MTQQLYSHNGSLPAPLPFRITLSDGRARTDPTTFTPAEIADAGYVAADPKPTPGADQVVSWGGSDWVVRTKTAEELAAEAEAARSVLNANLAAYRWDVETGGVDLGGSQIETTREAQAQISSTYSALKDGLVTSVEWKAATGWLVLDLSAFTPIAQAVATHVQACFAAERAVSTQIDALTDAELPGFDVVAAFDAAKT
ncbi:DUF4376 domain-containing protein [Phaeobacter gallaeciensis]|uniref:DUF4376 domain-containing protein n=1 Tax=Phaeobacter gallaeciensis TaxID=60890 RepID=UPI00237EFD87|nr:DUF4376 domain-containing protein [Phaeobacter gallaeciensis]MDE4304029.1 DUF4376 domain-containing protein [Phaeobacter gallaeciensis]MDE4309089.1 DUF4376 domain-containing protein [Phaeobacter gallaeciensis]MDE4313357.1 DUF4376 domain-containing protein [Phaeobacter gallaeciensis]MDE4318018.1 DUF4376 domain-containing protein [Phaeobacter gallaeciensis]MDE4322481.1 DUF4376 domain-containing protein [Phaeobacter gallaeciensis]